MENKKLPSKLNDINLRNKVIICYQKSFLKVTSIFNKRRLMRQLYPCYTKSHLETHPYILPKKEDRQKEEAEGEINSQPIFQADQFRRRDFKKFVSFCSDFLFFSTFKKRQKNW